MKKVIISIIGILMALICLTSCALNAECYFCGEEKFCQTKTFWGEDVYVCNDCSSDLKDLTK